MAVHINVEFFPSALCYEPVVYKFGAEGRVTSMACFQSVCTGWKKQCENATLSLTLAKSSREAFLLESQDTTLQLILKTIFVFYPTKAAPSNPESS